MSSHSNNSLEWKLNFFIRTGRGEAWIGSVPELVKTVKDTAEEYEKVTGKTFTCHF